jgi:polar amino acid transport system substrate-binding protein
MKKKMIAGLILALSVFVTGCGNNNDKETTKDTDDTNTESEAETESTESTFTVGFDKDFPPMGFVGDDGEYTGFDLELAAEVCKRWDYELKLQPIAWDSKDMELESKSIDCIWNGFTMNGREDDYTWSAPYMANEQVFVVKKDAGIATLADLTDKVVTVQTDSSAEKALAEKQDLVATFSTYQTSPDYNAALMDLESGAVDAVAMDSVVANYQIEKRGDGLVVLDETLATEEYGIGFLKGNEQLRDKLNETLKEMAADGTMAKISETWFGKDVTTLK